MSLSKGLPGLAAAVFSSLAILLGPAAAEIVVSPLRQVITGADPEAIYQISNPSDRIVDGKVSWIDLSATETGYTAAKVQDRPNLSAAPYLVVRPASFRLEPGARTTISVKLKKTKSAPNSAPNSVPRGERRSHLLIETDAARTAIRKAGGGLEVDVGLGLSTPVILRGAGARPSVSFGATRLLRDADGLLELETTLERTGAHSSFGRLVASMKSGRKSIEVAAIDNVAVFSDAKARVVSLPLGTDALPAGVLTVRYEGAAEYEGHLFSTKTFEIAPPR